MGDILYFKKVENDISSSCIVGRVIGLKLERDKISKRAEVEYHNSGKPFAKKQITNRPVRSLVKLSYMEHSTLKEIVHKERYFQYPEPYFEQFKDLYPDPRQIEFADVMD